MCGEKFNLYAFKAENSLRTSGFFNHKQVLKGSTKSFKPNTYFSLKN